jgi:hypothetical protein
MPTLIDASERRQFQALSALLFQMHIDIDRLISFRQILSAMMPLIIFDIID